MTAVLFSLGKLLIGIYLGNSAVASSFGAAGSLVLLLVWIYYSAQILFFGAEFTKVYANNYGSKIVPEGEKAVSRPGETARSGRKSTKEFRPQLAVPDASSIAVREDKLEKENGQTARIFMGLMFISFFMGIVTTILGFRRK